ncbi:MAG: HAMP domain-containing sensor histidine kinase [bacterium]
MINFFIKNQYCYDYVANQISTSIITYSHLPTAIIALLFGGYVLYKSRSLNTFILFFICLFFSIWSFLDLGAWVSWFNFTGPSSVMFSWSSLEIFGLLIFLFSFYFLYVSIKEKDVPFYYKILGILSLVPLSYWEITGKILNRYDTFSCGAIESNSVTTYITTMESIVILAVTFFTIFESNKVKEDSEKRKKIIFSGLSVFLFLMVFSLSGSLADLLNNLGWKDAYNFGVYSLFGMPIFIGFLGYLIVRFKTFNIRLFGAQALVLGLITLVGSKLFTAEAGVNRNITIITLGAICIFGYFLVKSVKKEIETRERIEKLADELELANERLHILDQQKSQFVSLASHQLRAPLTAIKGYLSMIMEGDYGEVKGEIREMIQRVFDSANNLVTIVGDFLDVSRIEQGKMAYDWKDFDLKPLVETVGHELKQMADKRGLEFTVSVEEGKTYMVHGDMNKLKQVFTNLTDNSIKYTPKGKVWIKLSRPTPDTIRFEVNDNGIGIAPETLPKLFEKFTRAEGANDVNVIGTGLGLYVAKEMIRAHEGGKIWAESDGKGLGSTFVVELKAL